jgi:hypothetical protein
VVHKEAALLESMIPVSVSWFRYCILPLQGVEGLRIVAEIQIHDEELCHLKQKVKCVCGE